MDVQKRAALRNKVNFLYDFQRLRIQTSGRTNNPTAQTNLDEADKAFFAEVGVDLDKVEKRIEKEVILLVREHGLWGAYLLGVKGVAEKTAGVLISSIDIHRSNTPSALWLYSGLGVVPHVKCSKCGHESWQNKGVCQKTKDKKSICGAVTVPIGNERGIQRLVKGERSGFNKWLKTKLLGVIGPNFLKTNSPYRKYYDDYKTRLEGQGWGKTLKHRHNAAIRYMVKMFLVDLWQAWRKLEGLPVREAYAVEYLGKHAKNP